MSKVIKAIGVAKGMVQSVSDGQVASADMVATGVTASTYGDSTHTVTVTVDTAGRVTSITTNTIGTLAMDLTGINGVAPSVNTGNADTGTLRTVLASDQPAVPVSIGGTVTVTGGLTDTQLRATPVPVSGTVTANAGTGPWPVTDNGGSLTVDGPLTDTQLRATAVPVSGTVTATGPLTDTQLRATPVPVSGTVSTGGLTDAQLRATAVPVSGSVTTGGLTDTQLRASAVPISGTVTANAGTNLNTSALALESGGNLATIAGKDFATQTTLALIKAKTDNLDTALSGIKTGTDKIPSSPATDRSTAAAPFASRLSDGSAFYNALTDTQLRATAVPISGTVTVTGGLTDTQLRASAVPVSAASLPLPSGASTSTKQDTGNTSLASIDGKQPAVGTAGTASVDVLTVQGIASMTPLTVDTELPAAAALADGATNPTTPMVGAVMEAIKGGASTVNRLRTAAPNGVALLTEYTLAMTPYVLTTSTDSNPIYAASIVADSNPGSTFPTTGMMGFNGSTFDRLRSDITNGLDVDVTRVQGSVAVTGTFWQATQPVSASALPLPTGAATAAKQPAIGTAGTASADVLSVQGISGGTPLPVTSSTDTTTTTGSVNPNSSTALEITTTGKSTCGIQITGTWSGSAIAFQGSVDGTNFTTLYAFTPAGASTNSFSVNGYWVLPCAGLAKVRLLPAGSGTGTANVTATTTTATFEFPLPYVYQGGAWTVSATQSGTWTADTELPAAAALADGATNPTTPMVGAVLQAINSSGTVHRVRTTAPAGATTTTAYTLAVSPHLYYSATDSYPMGTSSNIGDGAAGNNHTGVSLMGFNGGSYDRVRTVNTGQVVATLKDASGNAVFANAVAASDTLANQTTAPVVSLNEIWDGTQWVRDQANQAVTLLASASRTANSTSSLLPTRSVKGMRLYLNVTANTGAISLNPTITLDNPVTGAFIAFLWNAAVAITATGSYIYDFYPGATSAVQQGITERQSLFLDTQCKVAILHNNANPVTYSVSCSLIR